MWQKLMKCSGEIVCCDCRHGTTLKPKRHVDGSFCFSNLNICLFLQLLEYSFHNFEEYHKQIVYVYIAALMKLDNSWMYKSLCRSRQYYAMLLGEFQTIIALNICLGSTHCMLWCRSVCIMCVIFSFGREPEKYKYLI